ncbi:MAG: L-threonylcarbamoyladenylate synthase [Betaproteobacteria bacterium]
MKEHRGRPLTERAGERATAHAVRLLRAGALVAFPTETVYGLGADARNADAVHAIFEAKGRPADHPVIVHLADASDIGAWCSAVPPLARKLAAAFWPGPLTLILPRAQGVHDILTGGQSSVGLRVPAHPAAQALLHAFGGGIAAPSANPFGRISPTTAGHVAEDLGDAVALIIDGGPCKFGIESTIVAFDGETPVLLRPGGISVDALTAILGRAPKAPDARAPRTSGTLTSHYAPRTPARLIDATTLRNSVETSRFARMVVLARSVARPPGFSGTWINAPGDAMTYAQDLYAHLRTLDRADARLILIEAPPEEASWLAVRDRLERATHPGRADPVDDID